MQTINPMVRTSIWNETLSLDIGAKLCQVEVTIHGVWSEPNSESPRPAYRQDAGKCAVTLTLRCGESTYGKPLLVKPGAQFLHHRYSMTMAPGKDVEVMLIHWGRTPVEIRQVMVAIKELGDDNVG